MLDFAALEMASRLVSEQFSEDRPAPDRPRRNSARKAGPHSCGSWPEDRRRRARASARNAALPTEAPCPRPGTMSRVVVHAQTKSCSHSAGDRPKVAQQPHSYGHGLTKVCPVRCKGSDDMPDS